jgi:subtilisin-like proprotein convertase family protein
MNLKSTFPLLRNLFLGIFLLSFGCLQAQYISKANLAKQILIDRADEFNLDTASLEKMLVSSETFSRLSQLNNIYFEQHIENIPVYNAILNAHITSNNELLTFGNRFYFDASINKSLNLPLIPQSEAISIVADYLGYTYNGNLAVVTNIGGPTKKIIFEKGDLSLENIPVSLVWQPVSANNLVLAWNVSIYEIAAQNWWNVRIDAVTGEILDQNNWVVQCNFDMPCGTDHKLFEQKQTKHHFIPKSFLNKTNNDLVVIQSMGVMDGSSYQVYPEPVESPNHTLPLPPADGRVIVNEPADVIASPFGWHDTNGAIGPEFTTTQGNNAHAYTDIDANNIPDPGSSPDGGMGLDFLFPIDLTQPPSAYRPAAVTNLFYWNNFIHDFAYRFGFDEVNGNFQENNYGNGGLGSDYVNAEAQDGSGTNNANFATPPDGSNPRMQMFIGTNPTPDVDGDLDNGVIAHEYAHGVSNRLTGGPNNTSCLSNQEQMGEGWSDFYSLITTMEPSDMGSDSRGIGTYLFGQPANGPGIRPTPYSTNMAINPATYDDIKTLSVPHGVGYVWCGMIWDLLWKMVDVHGPTAGYDIAVTLVHEGMRLQPCSPGFVDGRDAILAADLALNGGANRCYIWEVFARRGLGFSATQGSTGSRSDGTEAFDLPTSCSLDAMPEMVSICKPNNAQYTISTGMGTNFTLSATGNPAGTTVSFSVNPVPSMGSSIMTIGNTAAAADGTYMITITGTEGMNSVNKIVTLIIQSSAPGAPTLVTPANMATNQINPLLTWNLQSASVSYDVDVATDAAFTNIVASATGLVTNSFQTVGLLSNTVYYWRVRGVNGCGNGTYSAPFSFTTANITCNTYASTNVPIVIGTIPVTINSTLTVPASCGTITDINLTNLNITHTWIGDLNIELISPAGTVVRVMQAPCGNFDNILINFDDEATSPSFPCPPTNNGFYIPFSALSAFDGQSASGIWTLRVIDGFNQDGGSLNAWSLEICTAGNFTPSPITITENSGTTPNDGILCNGDAATLAASGGDSYLWSNGSTMSSISVNTAGTYTVTITSGGCSGVVSANIIVNPTPTISGPTSVAVGATINIMGSGTPAMVNPYVSSNPAIATVNNVGLVSGISAGMCTITYTNNNGCSATTNITVFEDLSIATISVTDNSGTTSDDGIICSGASANLTVYITELEISQPSASACMANFAQADLAQSFIPTSSSMCGAGIFLLNNISGSATIQLYNNLPNAGGTLLAQGTISYTGMGWVDVDWPPVNVTPGNTYYIVFSGTPGSQCIGGNTSNPYPNGQVYANAGYQSFPNFDYAFRTFSCATSYTYLWSTGETSASINVSPTTTTTYSVTITDNLGNTSVDQVTITVNALPMADITGDNDICTGQSTMLTATGGTSYLWNTGSVMPSISVSPTSNTTYTVTVTDANVCSATASETVTVNPLPVVNVTGDNIICIGESTILTATGGTQFLWSTGATTSMITVSPTTNTNYAVTVTDSNGCSNTNGITVIVNPLPVPTISVIENSGTTPNDGQICFGASAQLTASGGVSYVWSTGANTATINVTPATTTTYIVTTTDSNGCRGTASRTITVTPFPVGPITIVENSGLMPNDGVICSGASVTLTAPAAAQYLWSTGATTASITVAPTMNTTYSVTVTNANSCISNTSTTITVNPLPTPNISVTELSGTSNNDGTICNGASVTLTAFGGNQFLWSTGANTSSITVSPMATTTYIVTVTNAANCSNTASVTITVNPLPVISIAVAENSGTTSNDGTICQGASATLSASGANTYLWSTGASTSAITVAPLSSTTYTVTGTDTNVCSNTLSRQIVVDPVPVISAQPQDVMVCAGSEVTFDVVASITPPVTLTYQWQEFIGGMWQDLPGETNPTLTISNVSVSDNNREFRVNISSPNNCSTLSVSAFLRIHLSAAMVCNNGLNIGLDQNCNLSGVIDMFLENTPNDQQFYEIIYSTAGGVIIDEADLKNFVGQQLIFSIRDICDNNSCWGTFNIEDYFAPIVECEDITISCLQSDLMNLPLEDPNFIGRPDVIENCGTFDLYFSQLEFGNSICSKSYLRRWQAVDQSGNTSAECIQTITVNPLSFADVFIPNPLVIVECNTDTDPASIVAATGDVTDGYPFVLINGIPVAVSGQLCNIVCTYTDQLIDACGPHCHGNKKVIRTWQCIDWCEGIVSTPFTQLIKSADLQGPTFILKDTTVTTSPWYCAADFDLPRPWELHDNCDINPTYYVSGPGIVQITGNPVDGYRAKGAPKGTHTFCYTATDCCGNLTTLCMNVTVVDRTPPVPVTYHDIVLGLVPGGPGQDGNAKLFTEHVNNNSYDNCTDVRVEIRRPAGAPKCNNEGNIIDPVTGERYNNNVTFNNTNPRLHADDNANDTDAGQFVKFCCEDLTTGVDIDGDGEVNIGYHEVIMRVWDDGDMNAVWGSMGDNYNESWIYVKVEDKAPPVIQCPPNMTIFCDWAITYSTDLGSGAQPTEGVDFTKTGLPVGYGTCGTLPIRFRDNIGQLNQCKLGNVTRDFFVGNAPVNQAPSCRQIITILPSNSQQPWVITPPTATPVATTCDGPTDAQIEANGPRWVNGPCDVIGENIKVHEFLFEDGVCKKWRVEYNYMNWCTNESRGPFFKDFMYFDQVKPVIENCDPLMFGVDANCSHRLVLTNAATDEGGCIEEGWLKWQVFVDLWADGTDDWEFSSFLPVNNDVANANNGNLAAIRDDNNNGVPDIYVAPTLNGGQITITIPELIVGKMSNHKVSWKVTDGCHNHTTCHQDVMVADKKAPTPYCINLSTALMEDPDGTGPMLSMVELWAIDFNIGSFDNCTPQEDLLFTFDQWAPQVTDTVIAGRLVNIDIPHYFDVKGAVMPYPTTNAQVLSRYNNGELQLWLPSLRSSAKVWNENDMVGEKLIDVNVMMSVWDKKFNQDFCWVTLTLHCQTCPIEVNSRIGGLIATDHSNGVNNVEVLLYDAASSMIRSTFTNEAGMYAFDNAPSNGEVIVPVKDHDFDNGISTLDLVLIQRHILGIQAFDSPYKVVASDINNDTKINSVDLVELRKLILGTSTRFTNQSWRFIDTKYPMDMSHVFPFVDRMDIPSDSTQRNNINFVGVKIGDVNGTATTDVMNATGQNRTSATLNLTTENRNIEAGETIEVPVTASNFNEIFGFQFTMNVEGASFVNVIPGTIEINESNVGIISDEMITMSFASTTAETRRVDDVLFTIVLKANKAALLSEMMYINSHITSAESYVGSNMKVQNIGLTVGSDNASADIQLFQNEPNPFKGQTKVSFFMPKADKATLTVYDVTGKLINIRNIDALQGINTEVFNREQLGTSGMLYYKLESGDFTATKKMIIVE